MSRIVTKSNRAAEQEGLRREETREDGKTRAGGENFAPDAKAGPIVVARELTKVFPGGVVALDRFSLTVFRREVVVLVGPSGAGKSTFLRCLNGLEAADDGSIVIDGIPIDHDRHHLREIRKEVGMVFQSFNLFPHLTVLENINLAQELVRRRNRKAATENTLSLLAKVDMTDKVDRYPRELSGGQQQRVAIARALALNPRVMLFDEATSALDPEMIGEVLDVMRRLAREGMTMIVVTHEMGFAREVGSRIVLMERGCLVEEAETETFFRLPKTGRAREFLSQVLNC